MSTARLYDFSVAHERRSSRMENQKQGHFALFRSLLSKEWASDTAKFALWVRIIGQAQYKSRTVEFDGVSWDLQAGQLVTKVSILARKLKDSQGNEKSPKQVRDMLEFFTKEKMITFSGNRHGTVITIINYTDYQGDFGVTNEVGNEVTNKRSAGAASGVVEVTKQVTKEVEQSKKLLEQELNNTPISPEGDLPVIPEKPKRKPAVKMEFDRERFKATWNQKASHHGLPRITSISTTTEKGIKRLYDSHLKHCKETRRTPQNIDTFINGYIEFGYTPSDYACGKNDAGKKYGIDTALTQKMIDKIISQEE